MDKVEITLVLDVQLSADSAFLKNKFCHGKPKFRFNYLAITLGSSYTLLLKGGMLENFKSKKSYRTLL